MRTSRWLAVIVVLLTSARFAFGIRFETIGPEKETVEQPGWPSGMIKILQHDSRVYSYEVSGSEEFFFKATRREVVDLVKLFSQAHLRDHVVYIKKEKAEVKTFAQDRVDYNVSFHYVGGIALFMERRTGEAQTYEPTLTIFVDPDADRALPKMFQMAVPDNIAVKSEVAGWTVKGRATVPKRVLWHAAVNFDDKEPAVDFPNGLRTLVTLWKKDSEAGFNLGEVDYQGHFAAAFSEREISDLKAGEMWLTLTVGNWLTAAKKDDPKLPWDRLSTDRSKTKAVEISKPKFYMGRLLFDDGSPAVLDPPPWPGAEIMITFPYAGKITIDKEGYFRVFFTPEQIKELKTRRVEKNIYIPDFASKGQSTALYAFPSAKLSLDKAAAGEIRIARPRAAGKK